MHDVIPKLDAKDRKRSLGKLAAWWIEKFTLIGRGDAKGKRIRHSPEYLQFIIDCYALDRYGRRRFGHVFLSRPKGCNKSGFAAEIAMFEAFGPCRFAGWAKGGETYTFLGKTYRYEKGEPMGRPIKSPLVVCLATAEEQTGEIYDTIYYNCTEGYLRFLAGEGMDAGKTRILWPKTGMEIRYSTAAARSKDGGLQTFVCFDETHQYNNKRLRDLYDIMTQNLTKRGVEADPWFLETTTMYRPGEESVAELTYKTAKDLEEGRLRGWEDLLFDHRYANLSREDFANDEKLTHAVYEAYGSAMKSPDDRDYIFLPDGRMVPVGPDGRSSEGWSLKDEGVEPGPSRYGWCDLRRTVKKILDPAYDPDNATRFYFNNLASARDAWLSEDMIQSHLAYRDVVDAALKTRSLRRLDEAWTHVVDRREEIMLGFDGSISDDSTALVGCRVRDGLLFLVKIEQKPDGPQGADWRVDRDSFDGKVRWMFSNYNVIGMFADTDEWEPYIAQWELDYGGRLRVFPRSNGHHIRFPMNGYKSDVRAELKTLYAAFSYPMQEVPKGRKPIPENVMLFADPRLIDHFRNGRRKDTSEGYLVFKETPNSPHKIDAAMAGVLAYRARSIYLGTATGKHVIAPYKLR
ncbi:hypothetical protein [Bifidobacterium olomucense]|uniref:Phage protein n=1 Tax=Bifidobacterium olomucense TaxID=2675324 RepID=A0A7Y0HWA7_9BIFI|nr:hypothetical protein [Bifidobacterium sp. DSM 109959]NMM98146.1 phage protein [Bifidobacterium sp. DSM 109959]